MNKDKPHRSKRLFKAKEDIINFFDKFTQKVFKISEISDILSANREFWKIANNTSKANFISFLLEETKMNQYIINFPFRKETRFTWGEVPFYELVSALNPKAYFSHYTAMTMHGLTEQIPKIFYLNVELQPIHIKNQGLSQQSIDLAFKNKPRTSNNIAVLEDKKICMLNSKFTNSLGIIELKDNVEGVIRVTDIERTLIDSTVRPVYSGGIFEVLKAFKLAKENVSINKLVSYLKKIDYTYPYYQAIGFYLEKARVYNQSQINLLKKFDLKYDFYLTHQIKDIDYSKEWRLFYPKNF
jgi:predicted transcriptional regulator of viral defense system